MSEQDGFETTKYTLTELSAGELKALIDGFPGGDDADYAFFAALLDEYASRPESPQIAAEGAKQRCMDRLGLTESTKTARSLPRRPIRIAAAVVVAVLLLAGSALAIGHRTGFFRSVFGVSAAVEAPADTTPVDVPPGEYAYTEPNGMTHVGILPGYQLVDVDEAEADRLLGPYVKELNDVYTVGDYTVTILGYIEDETGSYRVYYSIENPGGLDDIELFENNGRMMIRYGEGLRVLIGSRLAFADMERSTETTLYACAPGVVMPWEGKGVNIFIDNGSGASQESVVVTSDMLVPTVTLENEAVRVQISPMGVKLLSLLPPEKVMDELIDGQEMLAGFTVRDFSILLDDGTEFVVRRGSDVNNTTYGVGSSEVENSVTLCFNRLIDPEAVTGVTVDGVTIASEHPESPSADAHSSPHA